MNIKNFYIPENLPIDELRALGRVEFFDKLLFFVSTILCRHHALKLDAERFVNLKSEYLGDYTRRNDVRRVKDHLMRAGVIECDGKYQKGKKAMGFRLAAEYRGAKVRVVVPWKVRDRGIKAHLKSESEKYLWENLRRVTIEPGAPEWIRENVTDINEYNAAVIAVDMIETERWFLKTDPKTGRVFHNISSLKRELRQFLRIDGKPLVEVDISNAQPMLLHTLYSDKHDAEAVKFKDLVESGEFYETLAENGGLDRERAKKRFNVFTFGESEFAETGKEGRDFATAFTDAFPKLRARMEEIKASDYREVAIMLQELEAGLVIKSVIPILRDLSIPVLSIHDSLLVFGEHASTAVDILRDTCVKLYDLRPVMKVKGGENVEQLSAGEINLGASGFSSHFTRLPRLSVAATLCRTAEGAPDGETCRFLAPRVPQESF